ncbi:hypothetical protein Bb109J_c3125 [Bdellovibrio bacteriovorus]|uniref:hypothetical protein n=1 Tax=Bdellovibrio bacteriovorus TaxID=959 RepID=UPI00045BE9E8|nr:hypothetical protein [Bdellovibrio bacteriovorus]AHZ83732.1 hypothetical protein EP01_02050 [Bdellovibrio bacteriovorus]BEV69705.1 hypothetical protein Bb109J_c3125 [Bdellovibrio bacteriovorus]
MKTLFAVLFCLTLAACGGGHNPDKDNLSKALQVGDSSYYDLGAGKGLMTDGISEVSSGVNFEVTFTLNDGGSLSLHTFASSNLQSGFTVTFTRTGTTLQVHADTQGNVQDWSSLFAAVDASGTLTFTLDIHNNERPAHVLIWNGAKAPDMDHTNTVYNSAEDSLDLNYDAAPGNGSGRAWGFTATNAQLLNARLSSPQDGH